MRLNSLLVYFLGISIMMGIQQHAYAQRFNAVGIRTTNPSEILDVDGTMRVRDLPVHGATNAFYNGTNEKHETFRGNSFVVANGEGVLGRYRIPQVLEWFYMPPMNIPVDKDDPQAVYNSGTGEFSVDLYTVYLSQFTSSLKTDPGAPDLATFAASELDYYVLYYDSKVFSDVRITPEGQLVYKVLENPEYSYDSFFTIVYRIK